MTKLGLSYRFLTNNKCLLKYVKVLKCEMNDEALPWLKEADALDLISGAFVWNDTVDGHNYWQNLSMKWRFFYKNYHKKIID